MGRIQSNIGLATGMDIGSTVDSLMQVEGRRRDNLEAQTEKLKEEQVAITELAAMLISSTYVAANLGKEESFEQRAVASSNEAALVATKTGTPLNGTYSFTPVRSAQNQQLLSQGFKSDTEALGGGDVTLRFGNHLARGMSLDELNGGSGVQRGFIRITDRSGATSLVDLSAAVTINDVVDAINSTSGVNVTASIHGDHLEIDDNTGQDGSLMIQDVNDGKTAVSLGINGIESTGAVAMGRDIVYLSRETPLAVLNDGNGIERNRVLSDIDFSLRDTTIGKIDFSKVKSGSTDELTLGDILDTINAAAPDKLVAEIGGDGDRIVLKDMTSGTASFVVGAMNDSPALAALGLDGRAADEDGRITGRRIQGGLQSALLASLNGGHGYAEALGQLPEDAAIEITTSQGTVALDLTRETIQGLETVEDLLDMFKAAGASIGLEARLNAAKTGIELSDASLGGDRYLQVSDTTGDFAAIFGLDGESDAGTLSTGDLHLKTVSTEMALSEYNGGAGVRLGSILITDSTGKTGRLSISDASLTVGDVISSINQMDLGVYADLNETGDGIRIVDTADGSGRLKVGGDGYSNTAADLHLVGTAVDVEVDGQTQQVLDGTTTHTIHLDEDDTLDDLRMKINDLGADVYASTFVDGSSSPFRLSLLSQRSGEKGQMVVDLSELGVSLTETVAAQDAVLIYGNPSATGANVLVTSSSNKFDSVVSGISLEVKQATGAPVSVSVSPTHTDLSATLKTFVENYNKFRNALEERTYFDEATGEGSVLTSDATARRLDQDLSFFFTKQFFGAGSITLLSEVGVRINDAGKLTFDEAAFNQKMAEDPEAVRDFFLGKKDEATDGADDDGSGTKTGFYAQFKQLTDSLIGENTSATATRFSTLQDMIERNEEKIEWWNDKLERKQEALFMQFYRMELAVSKMQRNMSAIGEIQSLAASAGGGEG